MSVAFLAEVFVLPAIIKMLPQVYGQEALRRVAVGSPEGLHYGSRPRT
jgi:hypothetical protein